jgi:hypothetical protein
MAAMALGKYKHKTQGTLPLPAICYMPYGIQWQWQWHMAPA